MPVLPVTHRHILPVLGAVYAGWWGVMCIGPWHPGDWWLENVLVFAGLALLLATARWFVFSRLSYVLAFVFLCLHTLGAHFTYAEVPVDRWSEALTGRSTAELFGWKRNHFDRIVHFLYGLFVVCPYREIYFHLVTPRNEGLSYLSPLTFVLATSVIYELLEWLTVVLFGGELGMAFLGIQGDIWDAHQDILWALVGALLALGVILTIRLRTGRDFQREWAQTWRDGRA